MMRAKQLQLFENLQHREPRLTVLSYGGGQDSTAILLKLLRDSSFRAKYAPNDLIVVMSDTGDEHPKTLEQVARARALCEAGGVPFFHLTNDLGYHSEAWMDLRSQWRRNSTIGSKSYPKTCTWNLKIMPIYRFLEKHIEEAYGVKGGRKEGFYAFKRRFGKVRVLIGIAAGEESRVSKGTGEPPWMRENIEKVYPLIDLGWDRASCQRAIAGFGAPVPPPSNCMLCPFMSHVELLWLKRNHPSDFEEWVQMEAAKLARFQASGTPAEKNFGVFGRQLLPEALAEAERKHGHMTGAELEDYKMSHGHCVKSAY